MTDIGIGIGTSVGLAVVAPACGQVGSDITATGTVVNDGPMQGDKIALLLTVLGEDGSLHISSATYRFPDVANALVAYRMTATTQVQRALACDVDVVWGRPAT